MSAAETKIINLALVQLGEDTVAAVDQDPPPARLVKILPHLQPAIEAVLMKHGFLCALEYATLLPSPDAPTSWAFPFSYVAPDGCLRLWRVERASGWERGRWERQDSASRVIIRAVEGGALNLAYVKRRSADALDPHLHDAIAFEVAARACRPMNGSVERANELRDLARDAYLSALGVDGGDARADEVMFVDRVAALRASAL
ncbi:MAG: hypothetical protein ACK4Z5_10275 [Brevundimonas sp.]